MHSHPHKTTRFTGATLICSFCAHAALWNKLQVIYGTGSIDLIQDDMTVALRMAQQLAFGLVSTGQEAFLYVVDEAQGLLDIPVICKSACHLIDVGGFGFFCFFLIMHFSGESPSTTSLSHAKQYGLSDEFVANQAPDKDQGLSCCKPLHFSACVRLFACVRALCSSLYV